MILKNAFYRIAGSLVIIWATVTVAQVPPPPGIIPPAELDKAKAVVQDFCTDWKTLKFDSMYVMMSDAVRADMPKARFINTYGVMADNSGRLGAFAVKEALPNEENIVVKAEMNFTKENPPVAVNGVHNFHLAKENGKWMVKTVVPPIEAPEVGGSGGHPGE